MLNRGYSYREQIGPRDAGRTVLAHLTRRYTHSTEAEWRRHLEAGEVELAGRVTSAEMPLPLGAWLVWHRPPWEEPEVPRFFDLIFEDPDLLGVSKPSGLPTVPAGGFLENTLLTLVQQRWPEATPMHRLGRGTSGLVLFARTPEARATLQKAWRTRGIRKIYRALASGVFDRSSFTIDQPIGPIHHPRLGELHAATPAGKPATSHVQVLKQLENEAIVEVEIDTGRPHQIRIHLASIGHPLVGDPLYLGPNRVADTLPGDLGYLLHSMSLSFVHPRSHEPITLISQPPAALRV
jgi:23S rRNA pseudouridine1911/1915/1917 synthase